ncbi:Ras- protein Rab-7L1 [Bulinus truncatus]|nr:Ras- protein Rab-7L1 [Bulinus truncatus]
MYQRFNSCYDTLEEDIIKILVIGNAGVGKTAFVHKYVYDEFHEKYKSTIGFDSLTKNVLRHNEKPVNLKLQLWDLAGQDRFPCLSRAYYRYTRGCLILFDLTDPVSFSDVRRWKATLDANTCQDGPTVPCLLVANKVDLESERKVLYSDIEALVHELDFIQFTETSVKTGQLVHESITYLIDVILGNSPNTYIPTDFEQVDTVELSDMDPNFGKPTRRKCACS